MNVQYPQKFAAFDGFDTNAATAVALVSLYVYVALALNATLIASTLGSGSSSSRLPRVPPTLKENWFSTENDVVLVVVYLSSPFAQLELDGTSIP